MTKRNALVLSALLLFSTVGLTAGPVPDKNLDRAVRSIKACDP
jgi:hypothetical protein